MLPKEQLEGSQCLEPVKWVFEQDPRCPGSDLE